MTNISQMFGTTALIAMLPRLRLQRIKPTLLRMTRRRISRLSPVHPKRPTRTRRQLRSPERLGISGMWPKPLMASG